ncbi:ATP-binding protein [Natronosporangium hydrolyticum]|uniref:ATP-binding protein n=1 Tax=Natronosporangium hydrolyticum TaxID=2811111 RepID=A0A895YJR7_9ACTN|nr:DUF4143 domain-containing protein [Natronosporangium hydrolyticum]QSB14856.1 ATP-binding protein [Natronosporangium hydrolyticum]
MGGTNDAADGTYALRAVDPLIGELLAGLPALLLVGPRAVGKTTTAHRFARSELRLDYPPTAQAVAVDPDAVLRELDEPVLIDEWQVAPAVLGAVKRAVDQAPHPGRFLVTGSVRGDLDSPTWPGTGRLVRVNMYGLTVAELLGRAPREPFLDRVAAQGVEHLPTPLERPDLRGYVELALRSGFPEAALELPADLRERWLDSYLDQLLTRDLAMIGGQRDPDRVRRYLEALALHTAGVVEHQAVFRAADLSRATADAYDHLLRNLLVAEAVPAWHSSRLKRLVRTPKRYLIEPALVASVLRLDTNSILQDALLLGRLLDTFVMAQLRAELPLCRSRPRLFHLRQADGRREIDLIAELSGRRTVAIEVKAGAPGTGDARHLAWLRDELGDEFVGGVILHTGQLAYSLGDRLTAAPISTLWA